MVYETKEETPTIRPLYFAWPLKERYPVPGSDLTSSPAISDAVQRIAEDEILFSAASIPTIGRAGIGDPI